MLVKAKPGTRCPVPGSRGTKYIGDGLAVDVPREKRFLRLIRNGSLVLAEESKAPAAAKRKDKGGK